MKEQLISFETAKLAKEKGFIPSDGITCKSYLQDGRVGYQTIWDLDLKHAFLEDHIIAVTQSLLQKWLREKYDIDISIIKEVSIYLFVSYNVLISDSCNSKHRDLIDLQVSYTSYEEALEFALLRALKLINNEG